MGLLDDAIRDHLELKRRRGADPAEVERAEREALGPVRRHPEDATELALSDDHVAADHAEYEDEAGWDEPIAEAPADDPRWIDDLEPQQPGAGAEAGRGPEAAPPPHAAGHLGEDTVEHEIAPDEDSPDDPREDVLEETPEFLQDAPDHDRLWFEQKPPRDFNFDG